MVIDAHAHIGEDRVFEEQRTGEALIAAMDKNGVDAVVLQSMHGYIDIEDIRAGHDSVYELSKKEKTGSSAWSR
jgi:hypothetical protein